MVSNGSKKFLSIYGYTDFRTYLRDFYQFKKNGSRGYSYRSFSKDAGFSSPNILKLVIEGQRNIGQSSVTKFCQALGLNGPMADYFAILVEMNQSTNDQEKKELLKKLVKLTPHEKKRLLNMEAVEYLSHWLYPVLREMVELESFSDDPHWIVRRLTGRANVAEVVRCIQFLKKHEFIIKNDDGTYRVKEEMVLSSDEVKSLAIRQYHHVILSQASEMLDDLGISDREYGSLIIALPEDGLVELKNKLKDFRKELHLWALDQDKTRKDMHVVQINFQMYPQVKKLRPS